jgi:hypothetical protein
MQLLQRPTPLVFIQTLEVVVFDLSKVLVDFGGVRR